MTLISVLRSGHFLGLLRHRLGSDPIGLVPEQLDVPLPPLLTQKQFHLFEKIMRTPLVSRIKTRLQSRSFIVGSGL